MMSNKLRAAFILLGLLLVTPGGFSQNDDNESAWGGQSGTIPDTLRRPERGEAPRYPIDVVIGELGQGESPDGAYSYAKELLTSLLSGNKDAEIITNSNSVLSDSFLEEISSIEPRSYHLGAGRIEADGSVSFLVRFLGSEESISGEIYVRTENPVNADSDNAADVNAAEKEKWLLDDFVLEEKKVLTEIKDIYRYDFSPYERFY